MTKYFVDEIEYVSPVHDAVNQISLKRYVNPTSPLPLLFLNFLPHGYSKRLPLYIKRSILGTTVGLPVCE